MGLLNAERGWDGGGFSGGESGMEGYSWIERTADTESFGVALQIELFPLAWYSQVPWQVYPSCCSVPSEGSIGALNVGWGAETATSVGKNPVLDGRSEYRKPWMFCTLTHGLRPRKVLPSYQLRSRGYFLENAPQVDRNEVG